MIVVIIGRIGSGKTTLTRFFEKEGFQTESLGDIVREKLKKAKRKINRENMVDMGDSLRAREGEDVLARMAWNKTGRGNWIIEGVRNKEELLFLKSKGAVTIGITAPEDERFRRLKERGDDMDSFEDFQAQDRADRSIGIDEILDRADIIVSNDAGKKDLGKIARMIIASISSRGQN